ncbi:MAG: hypothetical protein WC977_13220, partial [Anaerovoracaceae bacterium]
MGVDSPQDVHRSMDALSATGMKHILRSPRHPEPLEVAKANPDDIEYWSVTTIIGALAKDALLYWSAEQAA